MKMHFCLTVCVTAMLAIVFVLLNITAVPAIEPEVKIHYLGHTAFILQFDNGLSVLTDYGKSNAYGLDSPVYDFGTFQPDIVTFSHRHEDHDRGFTFDTARQLAGTERLSFNGLDITPIRTCEATLWVEDNTSYLFTYKGLKILHVADAQAYIQSIDREDVKRRVKQIYPDSYDLLLMTIEGQSQFIPQAAAFIDLLQPKRVIPMHYWSKAYKSDFLAYLANQNVTAGTHYQIMEVAGAKYTLLITGTNITPVHVISLEPAAFSE